MSPRAAWWLEELGFSSVYDFAVGRAGWAAADLPLEGALAGLLTVGDAVRRDVFSCRLDDHPAQVLSALPTGQDDCIVLNGQGIVMGRTRRGALQEARPDAPLMGVMEPGPTTVRPDELLENVVERMRRRGVSNLVVATHEGRLIGILYLDDAEKLLGIESSEIERN